MGSSAEEEYAAFEKRVKSTVYVDNLGPHVTEPILRSAFDQFGTVKSICFIPNYLEQQFMQRAALVEMGSAKQAGQIIAGMSNTPFMVSGMPKPVRARPAEPNMFDDRPRRPGRTIEFTWLAPDDPEFEVAKHMKDLVKKHSREAYLIRKKILEQEKSLETKQAGVLKANYKKYEMLENIVADGSIDRLAQYYKMSIPGRD